MKTLQWRHKCAWNPLRLNCLCNRLFRRRYKKTWKLRVDSPHKGPVTRKMIPFHDVIMNAMDSCRCEKIFWTPIYWPRGQYIIRYFDPFTIFWPPPNSASNSFVSYVHPCEKVIGIFFRHKFFIIYFLPFVLVFIHDICEVVSINCVNFCWISIIGYASVTFWKR